MSLLKNLENEVVVKRTAVVAAVTGALHAVIALHWLTVAQSDEVIKALTAGIDLLGAGVGAAFVRAGVSPATIATVEKVVEDAAPLYKPYVPEAVLSAVTPLVQGVSAPVQTPVIAEAPNPNATIQT